MKPSYLRTEGDILTVLDEIPDGNISEVGDLPDIAELVDEIALFRQFEIENEPENVRICM